MKTSITAARLAALTCLLAGATLRAESAPANDDFADRQVIPSVTAVSVAGTTIGATQEGFEVAYSQGQGGPGEGIDETKTVWYAWTPPASGVLHVGFEQTAAPGGTVGGQTYFLLFKGSATPTLAALQSQGYLPGGTGNPAPPDTAVTAGQEYAISVGNTNYPSAFTLTLALTPSTTPTPAPAPVASVTARGKADRSTSAPGKFVVSLSAAASTDVTVAYKVSGSAVNGMDYKPLPGTLTVPAGKKSATVKVKPRAATDPAEPTVAVKIKLEAGDGYTVGSAAEAKVKIVGGP